MDELTRDEEKGCRSWIKQEISVSMHVRIFVYNVWYGQHDEYSTTERRNNKNNVKQCFP